MKKLEIVLRAFSRCLLLLVLFIQTAQATDTARDTLTVINSLANRIYAIVETTGDVTEILLFGTLMSLCSALFCRYEIFPFFRK